MLYRFRAFEIFDFLLPNYGLEPDEVILTTLMKGAMAARQPKEAVRFLLAMPNPTP